ncbi:MAG: hypothetical protein E6R03_12670 [Hyphomicrobiaceae bacterium]|nr:MAG: hypothetical protein E6R03_12670 [Hyphomicrobiaceae bacterium]
MTGVSILQEIHAKFLTDQYRNGLWTLEHWQSLMAEAGVCACICDECSDKGLHLYPCDGPHRQHPIHIEDES